MSSDFDWRPGAEMDFAEEVLPRPSRGTPGKATVTSRMAVPSVTNVIFRVADPAAAEALAQSLTSSGSRMSVQRDANGVANGAEEAVSRAASSSGAPLPEPVREKFESSLGADLGGVRVHTGSESAAAAKAVGARAYTVGQDIHFGDGQYGGPDPFSMHLLAHEVAHTVQQRGATPRRQHKLEVSTPGDTLEVEADRAADAMVSGQAAHVSSPYGRLSRQIIQRDPLDEPTTQKYDTPYNEVDQKCTKKGDFVTWKDEFARKHSGMDMYGPAARGQGVTPHPNDIYGRNATEEGADWSATPATPGPEQPPAWSPTTTAPAVPMPTKASKRSPTEETLDKDADLSIPVQESQRAYAAGCVSDFRGVLQSTHSSYQAMSGNIERYNTAGKDPTFSELNGNKGGLNWVQNDKEKQAYKGDNVSELAGKQRVGDGARTVEQVVESKAVKDGSLVNDKDPTAAMEAAAGKIATARGNLFSGMKTAAITANKQTMLQAAVANAIKAVKLTKIERDVHEETKALGALEAAKAKEMAAIAGAIKAGGYAYELMEAFSDPTGGKAGKFLLNRAKDTSLYLIEEILAKPFSDKIQSAKARISELEARFQNENWIVAKGEWDIARRAVDLAEQAATEAREQVVRLVATLEQAYRDVAKELGQEVSKSQGAQKGEQVRAAIEAIPKVGLVVSYCGAVTSSIQIGPFTPRAGVGLMSVGPAGFLTHVGLMKGYKEKFTAEEKVWNSRLKSLEAIAKSYGIGN